MNKELAYCREITKKEKLNLLKERIAIMEDELKFHELKATNLRHNIVVLQVISEDYKAKEGTPNE